MTGLDGLPAVREVLAQARALDLLGPMALDEQVDHGLGFAHAFEQARGGDPAPGRWLDLGSGGGLPGLVLAQYWPDTPAVLLDAAERRTSFLSDAVRELGWADRVQVIRARAEEAGRIGSELRAGFDGVWARSFGSPPVTSECAAPFLKPDGLLVVSEPPDPGQTTARWPEADLARLGQEPLLTVRGRFGYQVIRQITACPERFPRRSGMATKRPLYRVSEG